MPLNELLAFETLIGLFLMYLALEVIGFVAGGVAARRLSVNW